ncbi:hypothetical protein CesoFtcFv8_025265 [Champsocephalus esox]|nr:hypothetical protein CesoFtcFv8_025265 [Champsocephalus esox]
MHGEMVHAGRDGPHPLRQPPMGPPPHHPMQGALPPTAHSMPPSPSRIPFGPRQGPVPGSATIPRERLPNTSPRSVSPCASAILERRDVKPDEDRGAKSHSLSRGNEGLYADPYLLQDGRMAHGPHPNPGSDVPDHGMGGFHRASIRSTGSYSGPSPTDSMEHPSLYRQKSRNSQLPTLGSKTPPPSPHRMAEVRMIDIHGGHPHGPPPHGMPIHGMPPHGMPPHGMPPHGMPPHGMPPHGMPPHWDASSRDASSWRSSSWRSHGEKLTCAPVLQEGGSVRNQASKQHGIPCGVRHPGPPAGAHPTCQ